MAKINDRDYVFATACVRSGEKNMLSHDKIEKMVESKNPEEALKVLTEMEYGGAIPDVKPQDFEVLLTREHKRTYEFVKSIVRKNPEEALKVLTEMEYGGAIPDVKPQDFEVLLTREHKRTYEFVKSIVHDPEYFNIFLYQSDYHNIKVILKAEFLGTDPEPFFMGSGSIDTKDLVNMVRERDFVGMSTEMKDAIVILKAEFLGTDPEPFFMGSGSIDTKDLVNMVRERDFVGMSTEMKDAIEEVLDVFGRTKDPQQVDIILDKACYKDMIRLAEKSENTYLKGYVKLLIDTINLRIFVRMRRMNKSWDFFSKVFIEGGNITEKFFIAGYDEQLETFAEKLVSYGLSDVLAESIPMLKESGSFTMLEKLCDNRLMEYVKDSRYKSFGIEAIVGYILAKENEIKAARIIMAGNLAGLPSDRIRERLRVSYV